MYRNAPVIGLSVVLTLIGVACGGGGGSSEDVGAAADENLRPVLKRSVDAVIVPTYLDLHTKAQALRVCVAAMASAPAAESQLDDCRKAWIAARVPWEQSEGFLFGPVADLGLDPALDSWPVDHKQLDALMASDVTLTADTITANLGGGLKGFHTIEYLLWGQDHTRTAAGLSAAPRELAYLAAVSEALASDAQRLWHAWTDDSERTGYGTRFAASGSRDGLYPSQLDAVQELIGGMIAICDEVAFGKIAEPHGARDPNLIESQYSYNSLSDFADNIRSVRNVYLGSVDGSASESSLAAIVAKHDEELDRSVRDLIESSIAKILELGAGGVTFRDVILDPTKDAEVIETQREIDSLMDELRGGVLPLFAR